MSPAKNTDKNTPPIVNQKIVDSEPIERISALA
jgi:tartrate dehydratase alpha subunit/fumarate hydratase class I-like protein